MTGGDYIAKSSGFGIFSVQICKGFIAPDDIFLPSQEINLGTPRFRIKLNIVLESPECVHIEDYRCYINCNILLFLLCPQ